MTVVHPSSRNLRRLAIMAAFLAAVQAVLWLGNPNGFIKAPPVRTGWEILQETAPYRNVPTSAETAEFLSGAYAQIGVTVSYDPSYQKLDFPMGDVPIDRGVCTDVVIRAFRGIGTDLQAEVNADMKANFSRYPAKYGLSAPDPNIDHRRVPNLMTYFDRKGWSKEITKNPADYLPGDIVAWNFPRNQTHIGIVSDRVDAATGVPLIFSNSWRGDVIGGYFVWVWDYWALWVEIK